MMDSDTEISFHERFAEVISFVESCLQDLDNVEHFLQRIRSINGDSIPANDKPIINVLIRLTSDIRCAITQRNESLKIAELMVIVIKFLCYVCSRREVYFCCSVLYDSFLMIILNVINIKKTLVNENTDIPMKGMIYGIAEKILNIETLISAFDFEEHIDKIALDSLDRYVDRHVGIEAIGEIKPHITQYETGAKADLEICLQYLNLFVRLLTLRHALLMRYKFCLESKQLSRALRSTLYKYIEAKREDAQKLLAFFSNPTLKNVGILAVFDPTEHIELATFLKELCLPIADLSEALHGRIFVITSVKRPSLSVGRPFSPFRTMRGMDASIHNVRIKFKFTIVDNLFNVFYIQSPDVGEYLIMNENGTCQYLHGKHGFDNAQWRVILICRKDNDDNIRSNFVFCTRKWPGKFLYLEESYWIPAVGLKDGVKPDTECLFTLMREDGSPLFVQMPSPVKLTKESKGNQYTRITGDNTVTANMQTGLFLNSSNTGSEHFSNIQTIQTFLGRKHIGVPNDIEKIKTYFEENENAPLYTVIGRIAENTESLDGDTCDERMMTGLVEMISINFHLFKKDFHYGSILTQILHVCGLVMSCIWKTRGTEKLVCSSLENNDEHRQSVDKTFRDLKCYAAYLSEIECAENIKERNITEMKRKGKFCEELECLPGLKKKALDDPKLFSICSQLSILQQTILWQMYAIAKQPGHSDDTANHFHDILRKQMVNDINFIKQFPISLRSKSAIADRYMSCLGNESQISQEKVVATLSPTRKSWIRNLPILSELESIVLQKVDEFKCKKSATKT